jgi:hypothetical protein
VVAVADHQSVAVLIDLVGERLDVGGDPPTAETVSSSLASLFSWTTYLEHGRTFPSRRPNADSDQNLVDSLRSCSGGAPASRHPVEGHPQVLIIALQNMRNHLEELKRPGIEAINE